MLQPTDAPGRPTGPGREMEAEQAAVAGPETRPVSQCQSECGAYSDSTLAYSSECFDKNTVLDECIGAIATCGDYNSQSNPACLGEGWEFQVACGGRDSTCEAFCDTYSYCAGTSLSACVSNCQTALREDEAKGLACSVSVYPLFTCLASLSCSELETYYDPYAWIYPCQTEDEQAYNYCPN